MVTVDALGIDEKVAVAGHIECGSVIKSKPTTVVGRQCHQDAQSILKYWSRAH